MARKYRQPDRNQMLLLPPDIRDWVDENHLARFFIQVVDKLDLKSFYDSYEVGKGPQGRPPYDPRMMMTLILYCMASWQYSSRAMERMTYDDIGARFISGDLHPDHDSFAEFRVRHCQRMEDVFVQVLLMCHQAGLVDLLHVAIDSTVILANASRTKNLELAKVERLLEECQAKAQELRKRLESADQSEKTTLTSKLKRFKDKEKNLQSAVDFLAARRREQAKHDESAASQNEQAEAQWKEQLVQIGARLREGRLAAGLSFRRLEELCGVPYRWLFSAEKGEKGLSPERLKAVFEALGLNPQAAPFPCRPQLVKAEQVEQSRFFNYTDNESYLTRRPNQGYRQAYLGQVAVDGKSQIIVGAEISRSNDDRPSLPSLVHRIQQYLGATPEIVSADTGYASEAIFAKMAQYKCKLYVNVSKLATGPDMPLTQKIRERLNTPEGGQTYNARSRIVEPVHGTTKHNRFFTRFLRKGYEKAVGDWMQVCTVQNLLKLMIKTWA